jgi:hypothetical protein
MGDSGRKRPMKCPQGRKQEEKLRRFEIAVDHLDLV